MRDPLKTKAIESTHRSVAENGLDREDEELALLSEVGGCGLGGTRARGTVRAEAVLVEDAAARLIAAMAAADAALVWCCTFAQAFPPPCWLEADPFVAEHEWSFGNRWSGQNCCLHDCRGTESGIT